MYKILKGIKSFGVIYPTHTYLIIPHGQIDTRNVISISFHEGMFLFDIDCSHNSSRKCFFLYKINIQCQKIDRLTKVLYYLLQVGLFNLRNLFLHMPYMVDGIDWFNNKFE